MNIKEIVSFCENLGSIMVLAIFITGIWVWDLSRLPLQVMGTEVIIALLCYLLTKLDTDDD